MEDLRWFGLRWQEGPDCGGPSGPYAQSERKQIYLTGFQKLRAGGWLYPCYCSRQDVLRALQAPHAEDEEPIYPGTCRPAPGQPAPAARRGGGRPPSWRFRVPAGEVVEFVDGGFGKATVCRGHGLRGFCSLAAGRRASYQLAVVIDDAAMGITEVVRGADLLLSTARQLLLYRALGLAPPAFFHCPLVKNAAGVRLAKREDAASLRSLREKGLTPEQIRQSWNDAT